MADASAISNTVTVGVSIASLATTLIAGTAAFVKLGERQTTHEALDDQRAEQVNERHEEMKGWLIRVESKLDNALKA